MKLRIALLQMHVEMGNPKVNFAHARDMMEKAMEKKPDILVLPETWNTGFSLRKTCPCWPMKKERKPAAFFLP